MAKHAGIGQLLTVLALTMALVGMFLTYNGVDDLWVVSATAVSIAWLSSVTLVYYRKSTMQRVRAQQELADTDYPEW